MFEDRRSCVTAGPRWIATWATGATAESRDGAGVSAPTSTLAGRFAYTVGIEGGFRHAGAFALPTRAKQDCTGSSTVVRSIPTGSARWCSCRTRRRVQGQHLTAIHGWHRAATKASCLFGCPDSRVAIGHRARRQRADGPRQLGADHLGRRLVRYSDSYHTIAGGSHACFDCEGFLHGVSTRSPDEVLQLEDLGRSR